MLLLVRRSSRGVVAALCVPAAILILFGQGRDAARVGQVYGLAQLHNALDRRDYDAALTAMATVPDINASIKDVQGVQSPAICLAARAGAADAYAVVRALVERYEADPNRPDSRGLTALHYAASNGDMAVVDLLLEHGAAVDAPQRIEGRGAGVDRDDRQSRVTPLYLAYSNGRYRVAELLESRGAKRLEGHVLMEAKLGGALAEGYRFARGKVPEDTDPLEAVRFEQQIAMRRAAVFLSEHDSSAEAASVLEALEAYGDNVLDLIASVPFPESEDPEALSRGLQAWLREIQLGAWKTLQEQFPELADHGGSDAPH